MNTYTKLTRIVGLVMSAAIILSACAPAATPTVAPTAAPPTSPPATPVPPTIAPTAAPQLKGDAIRGGRLYDKWWTVLGVDAPKGNQALWAKQTTNTRTGTDTWRCKECHGWDYKGVDGAYGSGSRKTGFKGVMGVSGKEPSAILAILKGSANPDHNFSSVMNDQALADLALFLNKYLMDSADLIKADKSLLSGNATAGKNTYDGNCTDCHGPQGLGINWADQAAPQYVGFIAKDNPWEFLHKARFGQPGEKMPPMETAGLKKAELADLLAYTQSLPTSALVTEGGVLYDNWMPALKKDVPAKDQPLWAKQTTNTRKGADTWRCKECHGWDYKGVDGAYGSGSHKTGFKGLTAAAKMTDADLLAWLNGTKNADHNFSTYFGDAQMKMMIAFIQKGTLDTKPYINADKTVKGTATRGKTLYTASCTRCHGDDGKTIKFGDPAAPQFVGTIAADNPWEFFHKTLNGQPGKAMPSGLNLGWSLQDVADVLAYSQTMPTK